MKFKKKLILATLSSSLFVFSLGMGYNIYNYYYESKENREREIKNSINYLESRLDKITLSSSITGKDLARLGENIYEVYKFHPYPYKESFKKILLPKLEYSPEMILGTGIWYEEGVFPEKYVGPYAVRKNGKPELTWEYAAESYNYREQSWYKTAVPTNWDRTKERPVTQYRTEPYPDFLGNEKILFLTLSTIMYDSKAKIIGVTTVDFNLKTIEKDLRNTKPTPNSYNVLADAISGKILYHPDPNLELKDWKALFTNEEDFPKSTEAVKVRETEEKGESYSVYAAHTKDDLILFTFVPDSDAYAFLKEMLIKNLLIAAGILASAGIILFMIVTGSMRSLEEITTHLEEISSGNKSLKDRLAIKTGDEFEVLADNFNGMAEKIEKQNLEITKYSEHLEEKVTERTKELNASLKEITNLKTQQDADYFLTSLLLRPLETNSASSDRFEYDYIIEQNKKFKFKTRLSEIGGDSCSTSNLYLNNKKYTLFLNSDAMGKSIQGAGGALIVGSVLKSITERTKLSRTISLYSPERWLKMSFLELHKTLETFDGSMLVSMVIGLIDDTTGLMYYINAEHPKPVLYRDSKASFLEEKYFFRKLGTPATEGKIAVSLFRLMKGDSVFIGSDGKDDLILSRQEEQGIIIGDEERILSVVEKTEGELKKILTELKRIGKISDDVSLLKITVKETKPEDRVLSAGEVENIKQARLEFNLKNYGKAAELLNSIHKTENPHPFILKEMIKVYLETASYLKIIELSEKYLEFRPEDNQVLYSLAYSYKKLKQYVKALDASERLAIREPYNYFYLTAFAEVYLALKNYDKAKELSSIVMKAEPENRRAEIVYISASRQISRS